MKINKRNRVLSDNLRGPKYRDAGATTNSGGLETVDGPCGHLGDAPGMGSVRNRAAAPHTGAVCGVAQRYGQRLVLAPQVYLGPDTRSQIPKEAKRKHVCVCVK